MKKTIITALAGAVAVALGGCGSNTSDAPVLQGGSSASRSSVVAHVAPLDHERLVAREQFSVGLAMDGLVYAWGGNTYGQLGNGALNDSLVPVAVKGMSNVRAISAGEYHVIATTQDGSVWGWGSNHFRQLGTLPLPVGGLSSTQPADPGTTTPRLIHGLPRVRTVASNIFHNVAIAQEGGVYSWGSMAGVITRVPTPVAGLSDARAVAAGGDFALALRPDGSVWGWGSNVFNVLSTDRSVSQSASPVRIDGLENVVGIAAGAYHGLALRADGSVWTWGWDFAAPSGKGQGIRPVAVDGLPASAVRSIAASPHNSAVLYQDGSVWAWGRNYYAQLGSRNANVSKPVRVTVPGVTAALSISGGTIMLLNRDGTVYGIGANSRGQLGNNTRYNSSTPVQTTGVGGKGNLNLGKSTTN
jgi:alpha-tubulin suppressor-like RCC1 family protein